MRQAESSYVLDIDAEPTSIQIFADSSAISIYDEVH